MHRLPGKLLGLVGVGFGLAAVLATNTFAGRSACIAAAVLFIASAYLTEQRRQGFGR